MVLDPRRQQELRAWQQKAQTGALSDKQNLRMNYLQNRMGAPQPQQGVNPQAGRMAMDRLLPRKTQIKNPSDAQYYGNMVQQDAAQQNQMLSNPNQQGIGGSRNVTYDPVTGQPTVTDTLAPEQQGLYNQGNQLSSTGLSQAQSIIGNPQGFDRRAIEDSVFNNLMRTTNQQKEQEQKQLDESLVARGIPVGSEAYNNAISQFNDRYDSLTQNARDRAAQFGGEEWTRQTSIANSLAGIGPGMQTPNLQGYQAPPPIQPVDPTTSQLALQQGRLARRQQRAQEMALRKVGSGGGRRGSSDPNANSPFYG